MKCREVEDFITAYQENELPPSERRSVEQHLESCERCRSEVSAYEACARLFQKLVTDEDPPEGLRKAILEQCGCTDDTECCPPPDRGN